MITELVTLELNKFLEQNNYFEGIDDEEVSNRILPVWVPKYKDGLEQDFKAAFNAIEVTITSAEFEVESDSEQGSPCLLFLRLLLLDINTQEFLSVVLRALVTYNRTILRLASAYASNDSWDGSSVSLNYLFTKLKEADKVPGCFRPISLKELLAL